MRCSGLWVLPLAASAQRGLELNQPLVSAQYELVPPKEEQVPLVTIPIDPDEGTQHTFELFEGDSIESSAFEFTARMNAGSFAHVLGDSSRQRLLDAGQALGRKVAVIVTTEDDTVDTVRYHDHGFVGSSVLSHAVNGAVGHGGTGGGVHLVVVANGYALCGASRAAVAAACEHSGASTSKATLGTRCGSIGVIELSEMVGFGSAVNIALEDVEHRLLALPSPKSSRQQHRCATIAVLTAASLLRSDSVACGLFPGAEGCSVWTAYESLVYSHGLEPLVFVAPSEKSRQDLIIEAALQNNTWGAVSSFSQVAPLPLLLFSFSAWKDLGPMDEGFFLQGAVGEWSARARARNMLVDASATPFSFLDRFVELRRVRHRGVESVAGALPPSSSLEKIESLSSLDADHLFVHLLSRSCTASQRNGARCHMGTIGSSMKSLRERSSAADNSTGTAARMVLESTEWNVKWMQRSPSDVVLEGWSDVLRIGAVVILYDDALGLVEALMRELVLSAHHTVVLVSSEPWNGPPRDVGPTLALLARFVSDPQLVTRLSVVSGHWASEEEQRTYGNTLLENLPTPKGIALKEGENFITHVLVVDGDEFWHPAELHRSLGLVARVARQATARATDAVRSAEVEVAGATSPEAFEEASNHLKFARAALHWAAGASIPFARAHMATYWRSVRTVVDPPEALRILWLVKLNICHWTRDREIGCTLPAEAARGLLFLQGQTSQSTELEFDGLMIDPSAGVCHHLSYVRTTSQLVHQKLASFAHAKDVVEAAEARNGGGLTSWLKNTWHEWEHNNDLGHLHPTHPPAYDHVRPQPLHALPPALRQLHLRHRRSLCIMLEPEAYATPDVEDERLMYCLIPATKRDPKETFGIQMRCPAIVQENHLAAKRTEAPREATEIYDANVDWGRSRDEFVNILSQNQLLQVNKQEIIVPFGGPLCKGSRPVVIVLIVHEGSMDTSTKPVFAEVGEVIAHGLRELGAAVALQYCVDLRTCALKSGAGQHFTVVLGVHHLARYVTLPQSYDVAEVLSNRQDYQSGYPLVLSSGFTLFSPQNSVLYNFEHVAGQTDLSKSNNLNRVLLKWSQIGNLWDYSSGNVEELSGRGLNATHVPLGYAPLLEQSYNYSGGSESGKQSIDVLFFGMLNDYRRDMLQILRVDYGLQVVHANANMPAFGEPLNSLIAEAKVVLSLRYWRHTKEWKMTRFLRTLAGGTAVVVSEVGSGGDLSSEEIAWSRAVVFKNSTSGLAHACRHFVQNEEARRLQAKQAQDIFRASKIEHGLRGPVTSLMQRSCPDAPWQILKEAARGEV